MSQQPAIEQTQQWLEEVVIGLNFCPFAKKEFVNDRIHYCVSSKGQLADALEVVIAQCEYLVNHPELETSLVIFNLGFREFTKYLDLVDYANELLEQQGYEGVLQIASFHPEYQFDGESPDAASNYTNRSPYPMIHLLREESMAKVLNIYQNPELIPEQNIELAEQKGSRYFKAILQRIRRI